MQSIIISPQNKSIQHKLCLITPKSYVYLDHIQVIGMKSISDINLIKVSVFRGNFYEQKTDSLEIDIKVSPMQKQAVFDIQREFGRTNESENRLDWITVSLDAQEINDFDEIQLQFKCQDAYELEKLPEFLDDFLRAIYLGMKEGKSNLENLTPEVKWAFENSRYKSLLNGKD